jgi:glutamate 5-kinase
LRRLQEGARATWFLPHETPKAAYKAWIAGSLAPQGALQVDAGAVTALRSGKSLLPAGVTEVAGKFEKGDAVRILGPEGAEIARGLACYDAADAAKIKGLKSAAIEAALGYQSGAELIHADDLVLTGA